MIYGKRNLRRRRKAGILLRMAVLAVSAAMSLTACTAGQPWGTAAQPSPTPEWVDTGFVVFGPDSYDSADTAILVGKNEEESTLTFLNLDLGKRYTLSINGTVRLSDKYGVAVSLEQIELGDIVDITFLKSRKRLTTLQLSKRAWNYAGIENYEIDAVRGEISIGADIYKLTSNTQYLSDGKNISLMDINAKDVLTFQGIDSQVLTVRVDKGHGYLRLAGGEKFVGGWIEIGQKQIERIKADMLLVVPEGSYQVSVSNRGGGGTKDVVIRRDEETVLDVSEFEIPEPSVGRVQFVLTPSEAELYINGTKADASSPIILEYGLHQVTVEAEGYHSISRYIRVDQESTQIEVALEEIQKEPSATASPESTASPSPTPGTAESYMVYISAPEGVEVYLDGNYVGVCPCAFKKVPGVHVIILRKSGYDTRSYTIQVDSEAKDSTYSFPDMVTVSSGQVRN